MKGMLVIISGPSGSGKGTVVKRLDNGGVYALSISVTTRDRRPHERDGRDYFFCTTEEFERKRDNNELLEHWLYCGNYYGTPKSYVEEQIFLGKAVVLEIEVNGALQVKDKFSEAILVFLMPPSMAELKQRLISRNTEDTASIDDRMKVAEEEIKLIEKYDYLVINDDVDAAASRIDTIVASESLRPKRNAEKIEKLKGEDYRC